MGTIISNAIMCLGIVSTAFCVTVIVTAIVAWVSDKVSDKRIKKAAYEFDKKHMYSMIKDIWQYIDEKKEKERETENND